MSPPPVISSLPVAFPVSASLRLIPCASWVMDYLSAVSQYNDIHCCSSSCNVRPKDEASLHFLFGSLGLLLLGFGVSSVDFQLSSLSFFFFSDSAVRFGHGPRYTVAHCVCCICYPSLVILYIWGPKNKKIVLFFIRIDHTVWDHREEAKYS